MLYPVQLPQLQPFVQLPSYREGWDSNPQHQDYRYGLTKPILSRNAVDLCLLFVLKYRQCDTDYLICRSTILATFPNSPYWIRTSDKYGRQRPVPSTAWRMGYIRWWNSPHYSWVPISTRNTHHLNFAVFPAVRQNPLLHKRGVAGAGVEPTSRPVSVEK